jgi:DNA invertase Pin-like site-specific DNA recombinase
VRLSELTIFELRGEWRRLHRMPPPMRLSRDLLVRGITYKLQERAYGGLSTATARKLEQAGADSPSRGAAKPTPSVSLRPGTRLVREWRGVTHTALIHADGIEWRGQRYRSPSVVARKITGARWSGPRFFGLRRQLDSHSRAGRAMAKADLARTGSTIRCAIYTRKSSDEGLEQEFNSLDAQREACEAYIVSQRHAGWVALADMYDDGGLSGGSMERPALKRLLEDIKAGKVQIVVVYKVDRLTRSLADFAKIVDIFDAHNASFVSVTQQFNTTTSMGRLTLNMLLSFAQFEREIAGERIRDKIAASKRKGMWMGGNVPIGYDVKDCKLVVSETEASTVRLIFRRYAELGSVSLLRAELDQLGIVSKRREGAGGRLAGDQHFSRGALYLMLQNRLYRGDIVHQGETYPGQHEAILDPELWQIVQNKLAVHRQERALAVGAEAPSLLAGLIVDADGSRMTPTHATKKAKRYRYYISASLLAGDHPQA